MNKMLLSAAMAGIFAAGVAHAADTVAPAKVKCFGIAKAGKNDCKAADNSHSCKGQAKVSDSKVDFRLVDSKAACEAEKGSVEAPKKG